MIKRKILSVLVGAAMTAGVLAGCGTSGAASTTSDAAGEAASQVTQETESAGDSAEAEADTAATEQEAAAQAAETSEGGKTLVVYYSAQGHTVKFAEAIADELGADIFEITPVDAYSEDDLDWTDGESRVSKEHEDESLRDIELTTTTVENWESYDTVLIGYPIWWGIAAWPVDNFVKGNDFTGKTVIPFATSSSSGLGESGEILADYAGTGDWLEGQRFQSGESVDNARDWAASVVQN